jgi:hypothetical protein
VDNPTINPHDQLHFVAHIVEHYRGVAAEIEGYVLTGLQRATEAKRLASEQTTEASATSAAQHAGQS